jgi:hypothetical protein
MIPTSSNTAHFPYNKHRGPHPGIVAVIYVLLFFTSLISFGVLSRGAEFPSPFVALAKVQQTLFQFPDAVRINAFFQFAFAIPLGIFTAAVTSRLRYLGVHATGVSIALFGGIAASLCCMVSGLCGWVLSQPAIINDLNLVHAIQLFGFGFGGIAFTATLGLLMAGISVPCLFGAYAPKWLGWLGLILAGIAEISTLNLIFPKLVWMLPIVRFPSFIWMLGIGFTLIKKRPETKNV